MKNSANPSPPADSAPRLVVHLYRDFYPKRGGIEDHILTLAQTPSPYYRHLVLTAAHGPLTERTTVQGVPVIRAGNVGHSYASFCPTMTAWLHHLQPALVHLHHPCPTAFLARLLYRRPLPTVIGYHNDVVKPRALLKAYDRFQALVLRQADVILVGTADYLDSSPFLAGVRAKCQVAPYGIPLPSAAELAAADQMAATIRQRYPGPLVLLVGRLCYYKGIEVAIAAMQKVAATLLVVGTGPLRQQLQQQIDRQQVNHKVILVGGVDDATRTAYYRACDLALLPSTYRSEAFGLVMLQAQACTRPVICSDLPGLTTVNRHGQTGLVTPVGDADALAQAINRLLGDPPLRAEMGAAGRHQVETTYRVELMVERIAAIYDSIS
ncbi:MAG: glycosyltransferase [Caldilinea sp. CFX5]|nr:glycosyltransferase [Caldilinea sp. CFX5]